MPNWCSNWVAFQGDERAIRKIEQLFKTMQDRELKTNHGQLPNFVDVTVDTGYFFNIYSDENNSSIFQYETKWSPNTQTLKHIAEYYHIDFDQEYEESGSMIYGRAKFKNGILTDIFLENEDFDCYVYDEEKELYYFEGTEYDSNCDILEILLERKINSHTI